MPFVNFHTHKTNNSDSNVITVQSLGLDEVELINENGFYTIGIHPWKADSHDISYQIDSLKKLLEGTSVIGVGEVGLDKLRGPSIEVQRRIFIQQVDIAYSLKKPIIIHCIKAWDELLAVKKNYDNSIPWAIHGFNGSEQLARQLIDSGFYLSIGSSILSENSKTSKSLGSIPTNRLFLETDTKEISIEVLYLRASKILKISSHNLEEQIFKNFNVFFNNH